MNALAIVLGLLFAAQGAAPVTRITRGDLSSIEKNLDNHLARANVPDSFDILGTTRGVYLAGFGAVFSAELNLVVTPNLSPFHPVFTKQEIARIHDRKLQRLPVLKQNMREML